MRKLLVVLCFLVPAIAFASESPVLPVISKNDVSCSSMQNVVSCEMETFAGQKINFTGVEYASVTIEGKDENENWISQTYESSNGCLSVVMKQPTEKLFSLAILNGNGKMKTYKKLQWGKIANLYRKECPIN